MRRGWWLLPVALLLIALALQFAPWPHAWADRVYLQAILPLWSALTAPLVGALPGSLTALLLLAALVALVLGLLAGPRARRATAAGLLYGVALLAVTFPLTFGLGYHTTPLEAQFEDAVPDPAETSADPREQTRRLVQATLTLASATAEAPPSTDPVAAASECLESYLASSFERPAVSIPKRVKALPRGALLRLGFAGVTAPWLLEPHLDPALLAPDALAVALHELAHTAGFAREAETEAVALLAGLDCADQRVRYAAALKAATSLAYELPDGARLDYLESWPAAARADLEAANAVTAAYRSKTAARLAERVYDSYLSSQGSGGMSDYGRATDLLVMGLTGRSASGAP